MLRSEEVICELAQEMCIKGKRQLLVKTWEDMTLEGYPGTRRP